MIKHLRFCFINLLVLVSAAVMAQNEAVWKSLTFLTRTKTITNVRTTLHHGQPKLATPHGA